MLALRYAAYKKLEWGELSWRVCVQWCRVIGRVAEELDEALRLLHLKYVLH
jgi:hypothetical protein